MRSLSRFAMLIPVLMTLGCVEPLEPAVEPVSPVVERNPRVNFFRSSVRHFTEEVRVAANRFELGMNRSEGELLLDELKDRCSRIPEAPEPQFQAARDECVALVKRLEETAARLIEIDGQRRLAERAANPNAMNIEVPLVQMPDWVAPEELGTTAQAATIPQVAAAPYDAMKADPCGAASPACACRRSS